MSRMQKALNPIPAEAPVPVVIPLVMRLKAERVQLLLAGLPGWRLRQDGRGLENARSFNSPKAAREFVGQVCKLAESRRQPVNVHLAGKKVGITLQGHPAKGCTGGINGAVFNLAAEIG